MIKQIRKVDLGDFAIYPDIKIDTDTSNVFNVKSLKSYIELYTSVLFTRDGDEYLVLFNKKYEKKGYLNPIDIVKFLEVVEEEVQRIKEHAIVNEDIEEITFFKLI